MLFRSKSGITDLDFELKLRNSPHYDYFKHSLENNGESTYYPVDLQIDLGNACNSACIMCNPQYSSRLEKEFKILNKYDNELFQLQDNLQSWTNDDVLVDKFINELTHIKGIKYIHFLGGETLYNQAFYNICEQLDGTDLIVGTTTNGTMYDELSGSKFKKFRKIFCYISSL